MTPGRTPPMRQASSSSLASSPKVVSLLVVRYLAATALLFLAACTSGANDESSRQSAVPAGAIVIGEDLYMVPLAEPVDGCPAYRAFSPTLRVAQVIYFRTIDKRFVADRSKADCR